MIAAVIIAAIKQEHTQYTIIHDFYHALAENEKFYAVFSFSHAADRALQVVWSRGFCTPAEKDLPESNCPCSL